LKPFLSTGTLYLYPLRATFAIARELGFTGVEVVVGPELILKGGEYVRRLGDEYGLAISALHPPIAPLPGWRRIRAILPKAYRLSQEMGSPPIIVHAPKGPNLADERVRLFLGAVHELKVSSPGPAIWLETLAVFRPEDRLNALLDPLALAHFAQEHSFPLTFDTSHIATCGSNLLEAYKVLGERVVNVHLSDLRPSPRFLDQPWMHSYFKHHQLPGRGLLNLAGFLCHLQSCGYTGPLVVELSPFAVEMWSAKKARRNLARCLDFIRKTSLP